MRAVKPAIPAHRRLTRRTHQGRSSPLAKLVPSRGSTISGSRGDNRRFV